MKTRLIQGFQITILSILFVGCNIITNNPVQPVIDVDKIKQEIQAKENEFAEVYNKGEMKNIGYYADDAVSYIQGGKPLVGKPAIIEYLKANLDSTENSNNISFKTNEVFVSDDGNQVLEIGFYKVIDADSNIINSGNYMCVFVKCDGKYVCLREMSTSDRSNE